MKKIFFLFVVFLLNSEEIEYKNFVIKYSYSTQILFNKNNDKFNSFYVVGNKNSNFNICIDSKYIEQKIVDISSKSDFYLELYYDEGSKSIVLNNILGDFTVYVLNSNLRVIIKIEDITIITNPSFYNIISYPNRLLYLYIKEGRANVINRKESIMIISGESIVFINDRFFVSRFNDLDTAKNVLINNLYVLDIKGGKKERHFDKIKRLYRDSIIYNRNFLSMFF